MDQVRRLSKDLLITPPISEPASTPSLGARQSSWSNSWLKLSLDFIAAGILLILFSLPMIIVAIGVKLTSRGPVFFRQRRPGRDGIEFLIFKFRTMSDNRSVQGPVLTQSDDPRVTGFGRFLRRWKLDELPQLFNILRGEMSFVGPRPQPTKLWQSPSIREQATRVLSVRPGITSQATVTFRNEEELLADLSPAKIEDVYLKTIMPVKLQMEIDYLERATFFSDLHILSMTILRVFHRQQKGNERFRKQISPHLGEGRQTERASMVARETGQRSGYPEQH